MRTRETMRIQFIANDLWHSEDFSRGLQDWERFWLRHLGEVPDCSVSFSLTNKKYRAHLDTEADLVILYHRLPWIGLGSEAERSGSKVIIYGVEGDSKEAIYATEKGYLYLTFVDDWKWLDMMVISAVSCASPSAFIKGVEGKAFDIVDHHVASDEIGIWQLARISQFLDLSHQFYDTFNDTFNPDAPWLALLPQCCNMWWSSLLKDLLCYLESKKWIPDGSRFEGPLELLDHLVTSHKLPEWADLLCCPGPAVRLATLEAIKSSIPREFDYRLLEPVLKDNDPRVKQELVECIGAREFSDLYPYVVEQLKEEDQSVCDAAAKVCRQRNIRRAEHEILFALERNVTLDLLWAVKELRLKSAIPLLRTICGREDITDYKRQEALEILSSLGHL
jgi:hypothetical protein